MKFEYLALIGAALLLNNVISDIPNGFSWLMAGDIFIALAIFCAYIDFFIKQLKKYRGYLLKFAGVFAIIGVISYIKHFV
ncbi:hypothetical protein [Propionispira raffinosivorans]|uniref:hypothetical protein n=1 Tax=Propionispira raffinosivorans TaxID=86959 RepID=UPI0003660A48|nr:hypothetical protein [Propionispira raffinosivorans]